MAVAELEVHQRAIKLGEVGERDVWCVADEWESAEDWVAFWAWREWEGGAPERAVEEVEECEEDEEVGEDES